MPKQTLCRSPTSAAWLTSTVGLQLILNGLWGDQLFRPKSSATPSCGR